MTKIYIPSGSKYPVVGRSRFETASNVEAAEKTATDRALTPSNLAALAASETLAGLIELATQAEALLGADAGRAITPATLAAVIATIVTPDASTTVKGLVELATAAEAKAQSSSALAVTPASLAGVIDNPGKQAYQYLRIPTAVKDAETVTINGTVYEFDTHDASTITAGNVRVDLHATATVVKAQGTLTVDTQPSVMDQMVVGAKTYTFKAPEDSDADGEISIGTDLPTAKAAILAALAGTDGHNTANAQASPAGAWVGNNLVLTAKAGGTVGDLVATTESFTAGTNVFDDATLGTTTAGVDPLGAEATTALAAAINAQAATGVDAIAVETNCLIAFTEAVGTAGNAWAVTATMLGANNDWDAATLTGGANAGRQRVWSKAHVPTADEVTGGWISIPLPFTPTVLSVEIRVTATGVVKAWDGKAAVATSGSQAYLLLDNSGNIDWAAADTVYVAAFE